MDKVFGIIFKTTNILENKVYVGQTTKINSKNYYGSGTYFKSAVKLHGKNNFIREIIDFAFSQDDLNEKEIYWISQLNCQVPNGYNIEPGGSGSGKSEITKQRIREKKLGVKLSEKHKQALKKGWTPELRKRFSEMYSGITLSDERKKAISIGQLGKNCSDQTKNKIKNTMMGKNSGKQEILQCPYCNKMGGKSAMKRYHFDNCKHKNG